MAGWKFSTICLPFLLLWISTCAAQRSSYGESCDDTLKCDKRAWLTCRNGTCDCMKPDVMMYIQSIGKCASKAGERCKVIFEALDGNNIYEMMDCVENSNCTSDGFCACDNKYYEDLNGTCSRASKYMESCDSVVKCSNHEILQCIDGFCKCNKTVSTYYSDGESSDRQCVGLAGESCINSKCVEHSTCSSENVCVCDGKYYQDDDKKCMPKKAPLEMCTKNEQCMNFKGSQLVCLDGVCNCNPTFSRYGTARKYGQPYDYGYSSSYFEGTTYTQCVGLAGSPCLDRLCVTNSYCNYENRYPNSGNCSCMREFTQSKDGLCPSEYLGNCAKSDGCIDGLICKQTRCQCPFKDQEYDSATKKCVSKVDGPCSSSTLCVSNAQCNIFTRSPIEAGHCSCKTGFIKTPEGKCTTKFGQRCYSAADCDEVAALVCSNQVCQCDDFGKYSEKHRKCLGLVGAICDLTSTEPQCVENSKCERVHPRLHGVCTCPFGFKETPQYTCEIENEVAKKSPTQDEE